MIYILNFWKKWGFEIILGLCVLFILILGVYNHFIGKKGTFAKPGQLNLYKNLINNKSNYTYKPASPKDHPKESKGEMECRRVLQQLFNRPFPSTRPNFLRNPVTGGNFNLEIDCYNEELKLGIEYNGIQHYQYTPYFHKNQEHFMNQKYRDDLKRRLCRDNGIVLIEVPYNVKLADIKLFIFTSCQKHGYLT